jgi:hypothetical protein
MHSRNFKKRRTNPGRLHFFTVQPNICGHLLHGTQNFEVFLIFCENFHTPAQSSKNLVLLRFYTWEHNIKMDLQEVGCGGTH